MKEVRQSLTRWSLFVNPFRRVQMTVSHFAARLRSFEIKEPGPSAMAMTQVAAESYDKAFTMWMGATQYASVAGTTVRMLTPVVDGFDITHLVPALTIGGLIAVDSDWQGIGQSATSDLPPNHATLYRPGELERLVGDQEA